jgi:hypothetical protein
MDKKCKSCWWQEGGKCYEGDNVERLPNGISKKDAISPCEKYWNKRKALGSIIPNEKLIITSELRDKKII